MPTNTTASKNGRHPLAVEHDQLVEEYTRTSGAKKAQISQAIRKNEVLAAVHNKLHPDLMIDITPWVKPVPYSRKELRTEAELVEEVRGLRLVVADPNERDFVRDGASTMLEQREEEARRRGVQIEGEDAA